MVKNVKLCPHEEAELLAKESVCNRYYKTWLEVKSWPTFDAKALDAEISRFETGGFHPKRLTRTDLHVSVSRPELSSSIRLACQTKMPRLPPVPGLPELAQLLTPIIRGKA